MPFSLPNPFSFEGLVVGSTFLDLGREMRPPIKPERQMADVLVPYDKATGSRGSGTSTHQMTSALSPSTEETRVAYSGLNPARMQIWNLSRLNDKENDPDSDKPVALEVHFNPKEMHESIKVVWNELQIPGLSHKRLQYSHTENVMYKFDLQFDALQIVSTGLRGIGEKFGVQTARHFIQSLCYGRAGAGSVKEGAPPRVLFFWPNFLSLTCVVGDQDWTYTHFLADGTPRRFSCAMSMKEIRDVRLSSSEVLRGGFRTTVERTDDILVLGGGS
jgi:hypothetical protein